MNRGIPDFLLKKSELQRARNKGRFRNSMISAGLEHISSILKTWIIQWESASGKGFFQDIDARVKVLFLISFLILISIKHTIHGQLGMAFFLSGLTMLSKINLLKHYRRILILSFFFGFLLSLPSAFNIFSPGKVILPIFSLEEDRILLYLKIPKEIGLTDEGIRRVTMLTLRVMNSLSLSFLVLSTTSFMDFIRALKVVKVPDIFLMIIALSYKYMFIFTSIVYDMHIARKSRLLGPERYKEVRRWIAGRIAFMYHKSRQRYEEIFRAMISRGFSGSINLVGYERLKRYDLISGTFLLTAWIVFLLI